MKLLLTWLVLLSSSSLIQASDNTFYNVTGFVDFESGRSEFKSCIARVEKSSVTRTKENSIKIIAYSFDLSKDDINAYRLAYNQNIYNRPIKEMEADERHQIPRGYERHPTIYIEVAFEDDKDIDMKYLEKVSVGFGSGKKGDSWIDLHQDNFEAKIESLSRHSISGELIPQDTNMSFHLNFTCPLLN